ncbi:MAG: hypothetical protein KKC46_15200 [Proteobacteria bacterium]|nr:hypothetical protein [Pseudomonadota bacterium]
MSPANKTDSFAKSRVHFRSFVLTSLGATPNERDELIEYNENLFDHSSLTPPLNLPLPDKPHIVAWEEYLSSADGKGIFDSLKIPLVQLWFPIQKGISKEEFYKSVTNKGIHPEEISQATGLKLKRPEDLRLNLHQTAAGQVPIIITAAREDFVALVQALTEKNEPAPIPESMGAIMIAGYNNWDRVGRYRKRWEADKPFDFSGESWNEEFKRLVLQKDLYQDRFIIISDGHYSGIPAKAMGLSEEDWIRLSIIIRRDHECAHYFTRHVLSSMRSRLLDELIADYMGITAAIGHFRADWFLCFLGLENFPEYRKGGRIENYLGSPPLSDGAFKILQKLAKYAAENLEHFDRAFMHGSDNVNHRTDIFLALTLLTLEELASNDAPVYLQKALKTSNL